MVLFVLILILFDCFVRYSAYSTYIISLLASGENVILNNTRSLLTINEPFTFIINSNTSLEMLTCYNKKNKCITTSLQVLKNLNKNIYTLMDDIVATADMNGTWQCALYPRFNNKVIEFELEVEVVDKNQAVAFYNRPPARKEQVYDQEDYNGVKYDYEYGAKGYSSNNEKGIGSQNTVQNTPSKEDSNVSHQYYINVKNDVETTTTSTERPTTTNSSYSTEKVTSQSNKIIMIAAVIALIGIVVGVLLGTVGKKIFCLKTSDGDPARSRRCTCPADAVYEELGDPPAAPAPAQVVDNVAHRAPYPLPPAEREENKKYIHYDTPYDHRFDRPVAHIRK